MGFKGDGMSSELPQKILFVDTDTAMASMLSEQLESYKVEVFAAANLETAKYRFNKEYYRVVLVETKFDEVDGLALIQQWRLHDMVDKRRAGFILMTGSALTPQQNALVKEMKNIIVVQKPVKVPQILTPLQKAYQLYHSTGIKGKAKENIRRKLAMTGSIELAISETKGMQEVLGDEFVPFISELYIEAGNYEAGLQLVNKSSDRVLDPLSKLNLQGKFLLHLGRTEEAIEVMEKADNIAPKNMDRVTDMVDLYLRNQQPDDAVGKQKELLDMNPQDEEYKFGLFQQLETSGFGRHAAEFCRETTGPKEVVRYFNNKGVVLAKTNSPLKAVDEYQRALNYYPRNKDNHLIHFNIALAYMKSKDPENLKTAEKHLTKALEIKPDYEKAVSLMERLQAALLGQEKIAI